MRGGGRIVARRSRTGAKRSSPKGWGGEGSKGRQIQGREAQGGPAGGIGFRQEVENLVGAAINEVETIESEGRPGTIPNEPFQSLPVGGFDADAPVQAKTATVLPAQHILGVVGLQEAVAPKMAQDPLSDRVL
jgi:hypothetical protein